MFEILVYQFQVDIYVFSDKSIQALKTQSLNKMLDEDVKLMGSCRW